ncbi:hypothetical protein CPC08DRAFT_731156 [Agrocybe pediades]|nr:hypothetical protein CPC08DRAFT_731156 [Agrocybe pediades]
MPTTMGRQQETKRWATGCRGNEEWWVRHTGVGEATTEWLGAQSYHRRATTTTTTITATTCPPLRASGMHHSDGKGSLVTMALAVRGTTDRHRGGRENRGERDEYEPGMTASSGGRQAGGSPMKRQSLLSPLFSDIRRDAQPFETYMGSLI